MNNQNIIVYQFSFLYKILKEIEKEIHFKIIGISNEKLLKNEIKNLNNYIIITNKKILKFNNQFILNQLPINLFKMIERLNIQFLKKQFIEQSRVTIKNYTIDINSR